MQCRPPRRLRTALTGVDRFQYSKTFEAASWRPYDWTAHDGRVADDAVNCPPKRVVILDGAYSARPELAHLMDLRVLLDVSDEARRQRLLRREGGHYRPPGKLDGLQAEDYYFNKVMPPEAFDLVIRGWLEWRSSEGRIVGQ